MRYWPLPSVTPVRVFSINAGLEASTVAPGRTAPELSFTTPVIVPRACPELGAGRMTNPNTTRTDVAIARIRSPFLLTWAPPHTTAWGLPPEAEAFSYTERLCNWATQYNHATQVSTNSWLRARPETHGIQRIESGGSRPLRRFDRRPRR